MYILHYPTYLGNFERTFSGLRRLKTYLRSTMTQKQLNHLLILHTHQQHTDNLSLLKVAMDFVVKSNRRNQFLVNIYCDNA